MMNLLILAINSEENLLGLFKKYDLQSSAFKHVRRLIKKAVNHLTAF